ncbi:DUF4145 domain-containing protein [Microbacterium sp. CBA3102]|uniref:DUF4145 domain-containing protein n=1 Tax=Microbacterium sp. CBA3102 TaxID=2603598 RepID=UPI0018846DA4|nr:DUF4145 domain-containing protein [Microbacterium sp. CBA3102]
MASAHCAYCRRYVHLTPKWAESMTYRQDHEDGTYSTISLLQGVAVCDHCQRASLGYATEYSSASSYATNNLEHTADEHITWVPKAGEAKEKGITSGRLVSKIDELATQGLVRNSTKDAAHEIRHLGNDMAHGDIEDSPAQVDVDDVLALMDEVLNEVFQGPARTARVRARRDGTATI